MADWQQTGFQVSKAYLKETEDFDWLVILSEGDKITDGVTLELAAGGGGVTRPLMDHPRYTPDIHIASDMSLPNLKENFANVASHDPKLLSLHDSKERLTQIITNHESGLYLAHVAPGALWVPDHSIDRVLIGNAFHMFYGKEKTIQDITSALKDGGTFIFNSGYFADSRMPGTTSFYETLIGTLTRAVLRDKNAPFDLKTAIRESQDANRQKLPEYQPLEELTKAQYVGLIEAASKGSLHVSSVDRHIVPLGFDFWKGFIKDPDFIRGYLVQWGVIKNTEDAPQEYMDYVQGILEAKLESVFDGYARSSGRDAVDRLWYTVTARKEEQPQKQNYTQK